MSGTSQDTIDRIRGIGRVVTTPPAAPGFMGVGHTAVPVVAPGEFELSDPFILLMDDRMELPPGHKAGEAHPHAGFETVTFVVEGEIRDRDEGTLRTGDVLWMTAGSGVIHNEDSEPLGRSRILQLWLKLPSNDRWVAPRFAYVARESAPVRNEPGVKARVYSGRSGAAQSATHNYVPVTMVDIGLDAHAQFDQELPASYNGFVYVLAGDVVAGGQGRVHLNTGQVGWLEVVDADAAPSALRLIAGEHGARVVLYAGEPQRVPIVIHGPFVGESRADLLRISREYVAGRIPRLSEFGAAKA